MHRVLRSTGFVAVAVLVGALAGSFRGPRVEARSSDGGDADVQAMLRNFTRVYQIVESQYADKVDPDKAIYGLDVPASPVGAIPGMLRPLDPHSDFFGPRAFTQIREQEQVKYYGVGMSIVTRLDRTNKLSTYVPAVVPGSPAFKAGVRPGDTIRKVDETETEGLDGNRVSGMLRGPKGTVVHVLVEREGYDQPIDFTIVRDEIKNPTVDSAFVVKPGIGYI